MNKIISYFKQWNIQQWFRFITGSIFIFSMAAYGFNWMLLVFGLIFLLQAFFNTGCAFNNTCSTSYPPNRYSKNRHS